MDDYRQRIYDYYVRGRVKALTPNRVEELSPRAPHLRRIIRRHLPKDRNASILDLGCGYGAFLHFLQEAGYQNAQGVDRSPEQVDAARHLGITGVSQGDLLETLRTTPGQSRDVVVALDVIEHFSKDELFPFVDEVFRVLKPGGRWVIHTPNAQSPFFGTVRYGDFTHELAFTRQSIGQILYAAGFQTIHSEESGPLPHGIFSSGRWLVWKAIRGMLRLYLAAETGSLGRDAILTQNFLTVATK